MSKIALRVKAKGLNRERIEFMDGRDKGDLSELTGEILTVNDFGFLKGDNGDYVVLSFIEDQEKFYFGGSIVSEKFKEFTQAEKEIIKKEGLPVKFTENKHKTIKGRTYLVCEFYPEDEPQDQETDELPY